MPILHNGSLDSTLALMRDGYAFIPKRCRRLRTDVFQTRLLFQKTICMRGAEAARLFYDGKQFRREGAAPGRLKKTLFGQGGVQGLDGDKHRHRKQMLMGLMTPEHLEALARRTASEWQAYIGRWGRAEEVVLFHEAMELLCRAVCAWAGVPLRSEAEARQRTRDLAAMIDAPGGVGPRYGRGRWARRRPEAWIGGLVRAVRRRGIGQHEEARALFRIAWHRTPGGPLLDRHTAAVELLNILRPTVAIARYVVFAALALHRHPECRTKLRADETGDYAELFAQEVRRFYPFFPFVAARVRRPFDWNGCRFSENTRVLLDLYGTNHDARLWDEPEAFRPERFRDWDGDAFDFIPQGGGDHFAGHRCAGEWVTIRLMKEAIHFLTKKMAYEVPTQDLSISLSRMPAIPRSRFVIRNVRWDG